MTSDVSGAEPTNRAAGPDDLREEVRRLGPWAYEFDVTPEVSTLVTADLPPDYYPPELGSIRMHRWRERFATLVESIFPNGLEGRTVLDCGCNCGAFLFWAKELGAGRCFGFDVREHWIKQARFLAEHRPESGDMRFEVCDLYDLPSLSLEPFDLAFFNGIFYHLPDPVSGLKIVADLTKELMTVNTVTRGGFPDGALVASEESKTVIHSGAYGLNWFPTGPEVVGRVLEWCGFTASRCHRWYRADWQRRVNRDSLHMLGAREDEAFRHYDARHASRSQPILSAVSAAVPSPATVLVATGGDRDLLELGNRRAWTFPQTKTGAWTELDGDDDGATAVAQLEELRDEGAEYLVLPGAKESWRARWPRLLEYLESRCRELPAEGFECSIYSTASG